jgi:hypothetical protein
MAKTMVGTNMVNDWFTLTSGRDKANNQNMVKAPRSVLSGALLLARISFKCRTGGVKPLLVPSRGSNQWADAITVRVARTTFAENHNSAIVDQPLQRTAARVVISPCPIPHPGERHRLAAVAQGRERSAL